MSESVIDEIGDDRLLRPKSPELTEHPFRYSAMLFESFARSIADMARQGRWILMCVQDCYMAEERERYQDDLSHLAQKAYFLCCKTYSESIEAWAILKQGQNTISKPILDGESPMQSRNESPFRKTFCSLTKPGIPIINSCVTTLDVFIAMEPGDGCDDNFWKTFRRLLDTVEEQSSALVRIAKSVREEMKALPSSEQQADNS